MSPVINLSLCACGETLASPKCVSKYALGFQNRKVLPPISTSVHFSRIVRNQSRNKFITLCMRGHACISKMGIQICSRISKMKSSTPNIRFRSVFKDRPKWVPKSIRHFVHAGAHLHLQKRYPNMLSNFKNENFNPDICVCSFFMDRSKWVPKSIHHFVHVGPRLHLQNGYPNMLSNF